MVDDFWRLQVELEKKWLQDDKDSLEWAKKQVNTYQERVERHKKSIAEAEKHLRESEGK